MDDEAYLIPPIIFIDYQIKVKLAEFFVVNKQEYDLCMQNQLSKGEALSYACMRTYAQKDELFIG